MAAVPLLLPVFAGSLMAVTAEFKERAIAGVLRVAEAFVQVIIRRQQVERVDGLLKGLLDDVLNVFRFHECVNLGVETGPKCQLPSHAK